ncbi:Aspartate/glutamate/uridylate kinase [Chytriomyces sp. MP71]|nr:Aspartate/glutamate/uridylate kinase [Chytriomyces sp. MP71]
MATNTIVTKFGGTSVGSAERMLQVARIIENLSKNDRTIVVLSAMSSYIKAEGTTSMLLEAAEDILLPNSTLYLDIVSKIQANHLKAVAEAVKDEAIRKQAEKDVSEACEKLRSFMSAAEIIDEISPRSRDIIISVGEKLSARIFTAVLQDRGLHAVFINLDRLVDKHFDPKSIDQSFYDYLASRLAETLAPFPATTIPVVTGYLGPIPGSLLTTIGRGYTDLTAALIAVGLRARELQIWKEVDGIFTADPRKAPRAYLLPRISPEEAAELTYYGSEVIHPFTMDQVIRARIPIRIKNAFKPEGAGTVIVPQEEAGLAERDVSLPASHGVPAGRERMATAITIKESITVLNIHSNRKSVSHGFFAKIFSTLDRFGIVVDLISTSEVHVSMALGPHLSEGKIGAAVEELRKYALVDIITDMTILSLVGREMRHMVGIASLMFSVLAKNSINLEMISQGASEINISCVIDGVHGVKALQVVHDACILGDV